MLFLIFSLQYFTKEVNESFYLGIVIFGFFNFVISPNC